MFTGDGSAEFLIPALHRAGFANQTTSTRVDDGLVFHDLYIAAAAHCAPPGNRPTPLEIRRCRPYLIEHLVLLPRLQIVVCLGAVAWGGLLDAAGGLGLAPPKPRPKFGHGARITLAKWTVLATYHPSRQNTQTGRLTAGMLDQVFQGVRNELASAAIGRIS
jgi:uracil-DNA glycosylase family 4